MKHILTISTVIFCMTLKAQQIKEWPLYAGAIPNAKEAPNKENSVTKDNVMRIAKVSVPTLTVYQPAQPDGRAVIICPGGGYQILAFDKEGTHVAEEFNKWGVTAFVLKYRLPDDTTNIDRSMAPLQDAQQAMRWVATMQSNGVYTKIKLASWVFLPAGIWQKNT